MYSSCLRGGGGDGGATGLEEEVYFFKSNSYEWGGRWALRRDDGEREREREREKKVCIDNQEVTEGQKVQRTVGKHRLWANRC